jgi:hypothetical protein
MRTTPVIDSAAIRVGEALLLYRVDEDRSGTGNGLADSGDHGGFDCEGTPRSICELAK